MTHAKRVPAKENARQPVYLWRDNVVYPQRDNSRVFVYPQRDNSPVPPQVQSIDNLLLPQIGLVRSFRRKGTSSKER
jgi:hypothetical protein